MKEPAGSAEWFEVHREDAARLHMGAGGSQPDDRELHAGADHQCSGVDALAGDGCARGP